MKVKVKILEHGKGLPIPKKATEFAACVDLCAAIEDDIDLHHGQTVLIPCGFCMEVPIGYEAQVRPRSGLSAKNSITVLNSPGTIDADYRGEVKVILHNASQIGYSSTAGTASIDMARTKFTVHRGDRIAQLTIKKVEDFEFEAVEELSDTNRGSGGFGSTGVKHDGGKNA
jgi:dUTP pyrophosphatase